MKDELFTKNLWEQVKEIEEQGRKNQEQLDYIRATLLVNFGPHGRIEQHRIIESNYWTTQVMCIQVLQALVLRLEEKDAEILKLRSEGAHGNSNP